MPAVKSLFPALLPVVAGVPLALAVGLFVDSTAGWLLAGAVALSSAALSERIHRTRSARPGGKPGDRQSHSDGSPVKTLLFDDFQSPGGSYRVKEVHEGDPSSVIPSGRSTEPAPVNLRGETMRDFEVLDFFDLDSSTPLAEVEPKSELHSLVNKVVLALKDVLFAHSIVFFWVNREKSQLVIESMATDSTRFMAEKRFAFGEDLAGQVAASGSYRLVGNMSPASEQELLPYYEGGDGIRSAVAVPVFFKSGQDDIQPLGVIVADSKAEDAFGPETIELLGRFTKLLSALVKSSTDKYDLLLDSELLNSMRRLADRVRSDPSEQSVLAALSDEANRLVGWDWLTVSMYSEDQRAWVVQKVVNKPGTPYVAQHQLIDIETSIVGEAIRSVSVEMIPDLAASTIPRYHAGEQTERTGSFLCVPISTYRRCYGAVALEAQTPSAFSGKEVETLYRLIENAASALEVLYMNSLVSEWVAMDPLTGAMKRRHYLHAVEEEVQRAEDFGLELALVSMEVDGLQEHERRFGVEVKESILQAVARLLRAGLRSYDVLGVQDERTLGVLLAQTTASDAYLWAEKMRKTIAGHIITVGKTSLSVTVSVGVGGLGEGMRAQELMAGAARVLEKARENGGNLVKVL